MFGGESAQPVRAPRVVTFAARLAINNIVVDIDSASDRYPRSKRRVLREEELNYASATSGDEAEWDVVDFNARRQARFDQIGLGFFNGQTDKEEKLARKRQLQQREDRRRRRHKAQHHSSIERDSAASSFFGKLDKQVRSSFRRINPQFVLDVEPLLVSMKQGGSAPPVPATFAVPEVELKAASRSKLKLNTSKTLVLLLADGFHRGLVHHLCTFHGLISESATLKNGSRVTIIRVPRKGLLTHHNASLFMYLVRKVRAYRAVFQAARDAAADHFPAYSDVSDMELFNSGSDEEEDEAECIRTGTVHLPPREKAKQKARARRRRRKAAMTAADAASAASSTDTKVDDEGGDGGADVGDTKDPNALEDELEPGRTDISDTDGSPVLVGRQQPKRLDMACGNVDDMEPGMEVTGGEGLSPRDVEFVLVPPSEAEEGEEAPGVEFGRKRSSSEEFVIL